MRRASEIAGLTLIAAWLVAASAAPLAAASVRLEIDPAGSEVGFLLDTTFHTVEGRTKAVTGSVSSDSGDIFTDGRVSVEIEAGKLETGNGSRDKKMRETCLETGKHPKITFSSTAKPAIVSAAKDSAGGYKEVKVTVPGDLTIHGVKRAVSLPVEARHDATGWVITGKLPVKLSDYSIPDPSIFFNKVKDEVTVTFSVRVK
jgi:polyisoprenoid-binding protein YceI